MKLNVTIEKKKDGTYIAYNTNDDEVTLLGTGNTVNEAKDDFLIPCRKPLKPARRQESKFPLRWMRNRYSNSTLRPYLNITT